MINKIEGEVVIPTRSAPGTLKESPASREERERREENEKRAVAKHKEEDDVVREVIPTKPTNRSCRPFVETLKSWIGIR